jgi:hypothetical protein
MNQHTKARLSDAQKRALFHDGYIVLKDVIPEPLIKTHVVPFADETTVILMSESTR